jgi:hypothetical protein
MDSLSSAPGNRNSSRLLSAAFAIAASVSWAVNAATTPNFTEEPAGSPKVVNAANAQQAILDMLPADHTSRPSIAAMVKALEDGGSTQELTSLFLWAKKIVENPAAPPAAKEKAKEILNTLQVDSTQLGIDVEGDKVSDKEGGQRALEPKAAIVPPPPKKPIVSATKREKPKDKDLILDGPQSPNWAIELPWKINAGTTCPKQIFNQDGTMDLGDEGYLQLTYGISEDLPKTFITFLENRMGVTGKITYYINKDKKLEVPLAANSSWSDVIKAPVRFESAVLTLFIDAKKNNWMTLPAVQMRKPGK